MSPAAALRAALAAPLDGPLAARFPAPFATVLVADAGAGPELEDALAACAGALVAAGLPAARQLVLLAGGGAPAAAARARALRAALARPVVVHDPARGPHFAAGALAGAPVELDDELREAEAVVVVSSVACDAAGRVRGGPALLVPGLASPATRRALAPAGDALPAALVPGVLALVRVDFALAWTADPTPRAWAGGGAEVYARALAASAPGAALTLREARP